MVTALYSGNIVEIIYTFLATVFVVLFTLPVHEYSHARVAYLLGDKTAYYNGRMTINPAKHFDIFGTLMIILFGFGWAKGVPINPRNFKNEKFGMALTALAGPVSNIIMALGFSFLTVVSISLTGKEIITDPTLSGMLVGSFSYAATVNVSLAIFNFIPIPPLDGSKIIYSVLPDRLYQKFLYLDRYSMFFILGILLISETVGFGIMDLVVPIVTAFLNMFLSLFAVVGLI